jgi:hypothetical protein
MNRIKEINDLIDSDLAYESNHLIPNNDVRFLLNTIESQKEEIDKLREIQKVLVLTPMQRMTKSFKVIEEFSETHLGRSE